MPETVEYTDWQAFPASTEHYSKMLEFITAGAEMAELPMRKMSKLELGFEEAVVNVINYAYADLDSEGNVYLRYSKSLTDDGVFTIEIADYGIAFDPFKAEENSHNTLNAASLEEAEPGGLGIPFIKKIFTNPYYKREDILGTEANHLILPLKV